MLADRILVSGSPEQMAGWDVQPLYFTCPSLSSDDRRLYLISARRGHPNVYVRDLETGKETRLTDNRAGILKSYVYFDGTPGKGLGKASVCLDSQRDTIYFNSRDGRFVKVYKAIVSSPGRS